MSTHEKKAIGDMKHGLTSVRPRMTLLPRHGAIYIVAGMGYGAAKYVQGNFHGPAPSGVTNVDRFMGYLDAAIRHLLAIAHAVNVAKGTGGDEAAACACVDDESSGKFPPSMLPHIAHALASLAIGVECGVQDGLLPADPGRPWVTSFNEALAQKDDPASEKARIKALVDARVKNGAYDLLSPDRSGAV